MTSLGLGVGVVWGTITMNSIIFALVPYQLAMIIFGIYCFKNWKLVVPHEHFALEA